MPDDNTAPKEHRLKRYQWPKGVSGNPLGRPKGSISPKDRIRHMFELNPSKFDEFLEDYLDDPNNRKHVVEMLDGKPNQAVELEVSLPESLIDLIKNGASNKG